MLSFPKTLTFLFLAACGGLSSLLARAPGVDEHTVALWLFDEPMYPNVVLTDASPYGNDLRLQSTYGAWYLAEEGKGEPAAEPLHVKGRYGLVDGKFGRSLYLPNPELGAVIWTNNRQRYSSAAMVGRGMDIPERLNLGYLDWTIEFWFRAQGEQQSPGVIYEIANETDIDRGVPGENSLRLLPGRTEFLLTSRSMAKDVDREKSGDPGSIYNIQVRIPTNAERLGDGEWHHIAFCYTALERQMRHFVDGALQPLPEKGGLLPMIGTLKTINVGANLKGAIDEYRISDVVRYAGDFTPPDSLGANFNALTQRPPNRPSGAPLLFGPGHDASKPYALGNRKHVLIDGAMVESTSGVEFRVQPPKTWEETDFRSTEAWEPTPRFGSTIPDVSTIWDDDGQLRMIYTNGGMWGGKPHVSCLAVSDDGIHWTKPDLGLHDWDGDRSTNIIIPNAGQGALIKDTNPAASDAERYKMIMWSYYRGYYLYTSPDGIHFDRNETVGYPFDTDGSATFFWDDQQGHYHAYFRCVSQQEGTRRRTGHAIIDDIFGPWPFSKQDWPWIDDLVLARPAIGELPIIDTGGQVYRFKAHKYEWAPDVYVAFPWRYLWPDNVRPGSFLMVSRDGSNWTKYEDDYYFPGGGLYKGKKIQEALSEHGLIRRGSEIWQYGTLRFTEHGGALYGGVEYEGGANDRLLRLKQRLDGFVAVTPEKDGGTGSFQTKPFTFAGGHLELNTDASGGRVRVEVQDESGKAIPGFALGDCEPIRQDGINLTVAWKSGRDLTALAGRPVRLKIELTGARVFAFQFQ